MIYIYYVLHIFIFMIGVYAFSHLLRIKKKGTDYASPYLGFLLCWNIFIFEMFFFNYVKVGLIDSSSIGTWPTLLKTIDGIIRTLAIVFSMHFFLQILSYLSGKGRSKKLFKFFTAIFIPLSFLLGVGTAFSLFDSNFTWMTHIQNYSIKVLLFLLLFFTVVYNQKFKLMLDITARNKSVAFAKFHSFAFFVLSAIYILDLWNRFSIFMIAFLYALINVFPKVWYRMSEIDAKQIRYSQALEKTKKDYHLTPREEEICKLLLEEYSNKEIQDMLFISINTVKNHIYNLNKKLGIRSREELIRFFSK